MSFFRRFDKDNLGIGVVYFDEPKIMYILSPVMLCLIMVILGFRFNDTFFNSVFYTNIIIAIYNSTHFYIRRNLLVTMKQKRALKEQKKIETERENERKEREEKERQKDMKYSLTINCPHCEGTRECLRIQLDIYMNDGEVRTERYSKKIPENWKPNQAEDNYEEDGIRSSTYKGTCPYCNGEGIACAFFEIREEICSTCKGKGIYIQKIKIKKEIGFDWQEKQIKCEKCNGYGKYKTEYVNFQTLSGHRQDEYNKLFFWKIDQTNKDFFSKRKPRYS
jgi:hypothetical protein